MNASGRGAAGLVALALLAGGCATMGPRLSPGAPPLDAAGVYDALLGRNEGLGEVRAVVEARFSFAGREATFPGVMALRRHGGFRLDLLDPLDRPLAIMYAERGRLVQYRPAERFAASLGAFPEGCAIDPGEWGSAVLADSAGPAPGEGASLSSFFGAKSLEIRRGAVLRQSVRYGAEGGELRPRRFTWYCEDEPVMTVKVRSWLENPAWRLPGRFEVAWPRAGLAVEVELREVEPGPAPDPVPLVPRLPPETRWTVWNLPK